LECLLVLILAVPNLTSDLLNRAARIFPGGTRQPASKLHKSHDERCGAK
jgi:hypothetical protein